MIHHRVLLAFLLTTLGLGQPSFAAERRPNVLFIIVDDLTTTLSCYGDRDARTPHMDALAARGVRFERAYTQFALCNPSRASFLTGCYPERTKVFNLEQNFRGALPDIVTMPQLFKNAGYATGRVGKVFHVPDPKSQFDVVSASALAKDNAVLEEAKLARSRESAMSDPPIAKGKANRSYNQNYAASARPPQDFTDYDIATRAIGALETFRDQAFFLAVGFIRPHTPYVAPQSYFDLIDPRKIAMPPFYRAGGEDTALIPDAALRPNNNVFSFKAPDVPTAREARRAYLASTAWVDSQVGRVLAKLKELRLDGNTIIVLTGDHGYHLGEHGLWAKQTLFENGTRVPLMVVAPGVKPGVSAGLVEQVDIYPTLAELAGFEVPRHIQGVSLQPLLAVPRSQGKAAVFSTMVSTHTRLTGHSIRTDRFRYIEWDDGRAGRQLYDYETDPDELRNLAADPGHADRAARLKEQLAAHLRAVAANGK